MAVVVVAAEACPSSSAVVFGLAAAAVAEVVVVAENVVGAFDELMHFQATIQGPRPYYVDVRAFAVRKFADADAIVAVGNQTTTAAFVVPEQCETFRIRKFVPPFADAVEDFSILVQVVTAAFAKFVSVDLLPVVAVDS